MVTKGYRKGVYERVTKGINGRDLLTGPVFSHQVTVRIALARLALI